MLEELVLEEKCNLPLPSLRGGCSCSVARHSGFCRPLRTHNPGKDFDVRGNSLAATLTHSKTIGADRAVSHSLVMVSEQCYVRKPSGVSCGWQVLSQKAEFPRDYLLPMRSGNLKSCLRRELRHDTAHALQKRVMDVLVSDGQKLFAHGTCHFWSPHSGNFLPNAAGALKVEKSDRDMLGGWMAQESDRCNRVARVTIQSVQARVASTFSDQSDHDPLHESDAIEEICFFLQKQGSSAKAHRQIFEAGKPAQGSAQTPHKEFVARKSVHSTVAQ